MAGGSPANELRPSVVYRQSLKEEKEVLGPGSRSGGKNTWDYKLNGHVRRKIGDENKMAHF
jgi:hypothetical protein